jgi:hypothetical protein
MIIDPELTSRYWIVRKTVCLLGYYGGLRSIELRSIEFGKTFESGEKSFDVDQAGYWFSYERGKQRGLPVVSTFCVPRRQEDWSVPISGSDRNPVDYDPASVIDLYLELLELDLKSTRDQLSGGFFKSAHGKNGKFYRNVPMGKNLIERVGREFAEELFLPNPASFTSHCWRRTCGTNASDSGVNVTTLMAFMGWKTPKTAIGYVAKSRLTSYNMSMFLCNVQRQNSDLDQIIDKSKPFVRQLKPEQIPVPKIPKVPKVLKKAKIGKVAAEDLATSRFSEKLALARKSGSTSRTVEAQTVDETNFSIVQSINQQVFDESDGEISSRSDSVLGESVSEIVRTDRGSGSSVVVSSGSGSGGSSEIDPRVTSILSNLQHHGDLHLHFHFSKN